MENLGNLKFIKKEILSDSKQLTPLIVKCIEVGIWPMIKYNREISELVIKRQKYLSILSNKFGFNSTVVKQQVDGWISKLDLRVYAIDTVYKISDNFISGFGSTIIKYKNLLIYLEMLKYNNLIHYKEDFIKDKIVQTLFVQLIEPTIDFYSDNNYGFKCGRNCHQAIGVLNNFLRSNFDYKKTYNDLFILNISINFFFNCVHINWLLKNYPFPKKFINILSSWLFGGMLYNSEFKVPLTIFLKGSIIGYSLVNFTLNGLEQLIKPNNKYFFNKGDCKYYHKINNDISYIDLSKDWSFIRSSIVRVVGTISIFVNDKNYAYKIHNKIENFLKKRGLNLSLIKCNILKWQSNSKIYYLGFTYQNILVKTYSKLNINLKFKKNLYIFPSYFEVQTLKKRIKKLIKKSVNFLSCKLLIILNTIIKSWWNYFGVGSLNNFFSIDFYIWFKIWKYLQKKYKKLPIKLLIKMFNKDIENHTTKIWKLNKNLGVLNLNVLNKNFKVLFLLLFSKFNNPIFVNKLCQKKHLIKSSSYINKPICDQYVFNIIKLRNNKKSVNY